VISSKYRLCHGPRRPNGGEGRTEEGGFLFVRFFLPAFRPPGGQIARIRRGHYDETQQDDEDKEERDRTLRAELGPGRAALFPIPYRTNRRITVEPSLASPLSQGPRERSGQSNVMSG
jgi:hypothetical protein